MFKTYRRLGPFALGMFVLQNSIVAIAGILIFIFLLAVKVSNVDSMIGSTEGLPDLNSAFDTLVNFGLLGSVALTIAGAVVACIIALVQYYGYRYMLDEHEMHIKKGILNTEEITIPYRHIVDIEIERPLIYQILGASILTIYSRADTNVGMTSEDEAEGRLPAVRKGFAEEFRDQLLTLAHEQDTIRD